VVLCEKQVKGYVQISSLKHESGTVLVKDLDKHILYISVYSR